MKRFLALSLAIIFLLSGCSSGKALKVKDDLKSQTNITSAQNSSTQIKVNTTAPVKKQSGGETPERSEKLQNEAEQVAMEIDKIMDSLEDIDESILDF